MVQGPGFGVEGLGCGLFLLVWAAPLLTARAGCRVSGPS